ALERGGQRREVLGAIRSDPRVAGPGRALPEASGRGAQERPDGGCAGDTDADRLPEQAQRKRRGGPLPIGHVCPAAEAHVVACGCCSPLSSERDHSLPPSQAPPPMPAIPSGQASADRAINTESIRRL